MHLQFHKDFTKQHKKAPTIVSRRVEERLRIFVKNTYNPLLNNHKLSGSREGQWSINITGNWRAIYEFTGPDSVIFVELGTHSQLYK